MTKDQEVRKAGVILQERISDILKYADLPLEGKQALSIAVSLLLEPITDLKRIADASEKIVRALEGIEINTRGRT